MNHFETLTFRSTLSSKLLFEAAMGNMTETWTREPVEDSTTSHGYPVTEQNTGHQLPRLPGDVLEQLHVAAVVSQLADLRHRVARVQGRA